MFDLQVIACKVYATLVNLPEARDDDRILLVDIWKKEVEGLENESFLTLFLAGKLSNPETITRIRRKLQEKHANLRGDKWDKRHQIEAIVCEQLTFFDKW